MIPTKGHVRENIDLTWLFREDQKSHSTDTKGHFALERNSYFSKSRADSLSSPSHPLLYIFTPLTLTLGKVIGSPVHKMLQTECLGDSRWLLNSPLGKVIKPGAGAEAGFQSSPLSEPSRHLGFGPFQCSQQVRKKCADSSQ